MASSNKVFVSPGVYTSERDLTFVAQSVGVTTLGIVGETTQGPAFEPIFITNFNEFQTYFGGTSPEKYINTQIPKYELPYICKSYLQQSNQLFVTRVLGLSGYDAGPSWSIKTIGSVNPSTIVAITPPSGTTSTGYTSGFVLNFTGTTGTSLNVTYGASPDINLIPSYYNTYTDFNGSNSSINQDVLTLMSNEINAYHAARLISGATASGSTVLGWGVLSAATYTTLISSSVGTVTGTTNFLDVTNVNNGTLNTNLNDAWFYSQFTYVPYGGSPYINTYTGLGFGMSLSAFAPVGVVAAATYSGSVKFYGTMYSGSPHFDYDDLIVATLRSRGITNYNSTNNGPFYEVSGTTAVPNVNMNCTGSYSGVQFNPFTTFAISGKTWDNNTFQFETSMQTSDTNYISKVFGKSNFGKSRTDVPLFVEETYSSLLLTGYRSNKIRGLNCNLVTLGSAKSLDTDSIGFYLEQYQTPETPFLVSELRGNKVYRLFKFVLISDGNAANQLVKMSIANISFNNGTFDVLVRDFYDNDQNVRVIESFTNCSMDPTQNNYIANKIGTSNGEFQVKSKYIMLEMNEDAPTDALPCGFEGYVFREYANAKPPFVIYKTKYYKPGETLYNPPFGSGNGGDNPVISSGENLRKAYLGISNITGIDYDFYHYKGKQLPISLATDTTGLGWGYKTKGFHMDSGATVINISSNYITSGTSAFEVGTQSFITEPTDPTEDYYRLFSRKFTLYANGGFDGWDIYREYRTNSDRFALGQTGYKFGAAASITYPTATGWGAFKQITGPNQENWGNTDFYAYKWGLSTFSNPEATNINVFVTPGIDYVNNSNLIEDAIDMIETDRADSIYICTTPDFNLFLPTYSDISDGLIFPQECVDNLEQTGIDSNYTATYYPWILTRDSVNNTQIYIPPTGEVVKNLALTDNIAYPWFASAGYTRGLVNSIRARKKLTQEDRDTLYKGRINPIATFSDVGTVIWGNKTLQIKQSALDRINVRRLLLQARKLISAVAIRLLFEQNDGKVRQDFLDSVNPILDSIRRDRGLIDFRVTVSNTPEDLDSNTLTGKIFLKPTRALEYIDIEFVITPTGASFDDV
jgi:hypothetical protein